MFLFSNPADSPTVPPPAAKSVLIVDDDPAILKVLSRALGDRYEVRTAENGRAALLLASARRPDLVLLDIAMPGTCGFDVLRQLKALSPDLGVVMVTGDDRLEMIAHAFDRGATAYLTKPFRLAEVWGLVEQALAVQDNARKLRRSRASSPAKSLD